MGDFMRARGRAWRRLVKFAAAACVAIGLAGFPRMADGSVTLAPDASAIVGFRPGPTGGTYLPPSPLPPGRHGTLIWLRPAPAPPGARAWLVIYKSTLWNGRPTAVSGFVVVPKGRAPASGRPILAWAHGTTGGATWCSPSTIANPARNFIDYFSPRNSYEFDIGVPALTTFLREGYVVTATDYQGLGTPGVHQYLVGSTEARSVLDSILAARQVPGAHAGTRAVALGWSQGGGSAIFTNQEAAYGAPVRFLGSVDLAPAAGVGVELERRVPPNPNATPGSIAFTNSELINFYSGMHDAYPWLRLSRVLTRVGLQLLAGNGRMCSEKFGDVVIYHYVDDPAAYLKTPVPPDWLRWINKQTAGNAATTAPSLVIQGTKDTAINPYATTAYVRRACRVSEPVEYAVIPGGTHTSIVTGSQREYVTWIARRFAGQPAPSSCR